MKTGNYRILAVIVITMPCIATSCGGGGGTVTPSYGSIESYVYAAIGSEPGINVRSTIKEKGE